MPIANRYTCGDVVVAVWAIEETWEQLAAMLGDDALLRHARSFGSEARRAEWLAVRLLLRAVLGSRRVSNIWIAVALCLQVSAGI